MSSQRRFLLILAVSAFAHFSHYIYTSIFPNFAVQELGLTAGTYGLVEGLREVPGLLVIVLAAITAALAEERLVAACTLITGVGVGLFSLVHGMPMLVLATLTQSIGFHLWTVSQDGLVLKEYSTNRGFYLGRLRAASSAAVLAGTVTVALLSRWVTLRQFFLVGAVMGLVGAVLALGLRPNREAPRRHRFVFRWQYRSYYTLSLLAGVRRHMVMTFAVFALVRLYGTPVHIMATLLAIHNFLAILIRPRVGRLVDRIGVRRALLFSYGLLLPVFLGYAFIRYPWAAYGLFLLDHMLTSFDVAIPSYASRLISPSELSPSLATGLTIEHVFGVSVPMLGGWLWDAFGAQVPFLFGAGIAATMVAYAWYVLPRAGFGAPAEVAPGT